jgi:hypothetical protein
LRAERRTSLVSSLCSTDGLLLSLPRELCWRTLAAFQVITHMKSFFAYNGDSEVACTDNTSQFSCSGSNIWHPAHCTHSH